MLEVCGVFFLGGLLRASPLLRLVVVPGGSHVSRAVSPECKNRRTRESFP